VLMFGAFIIGNCLAIILNVREYVYADGKTAAKIKNTEDRKMNAILKNATIDENNEALVGFAQTIDFTELFDHIVNFAEIKCAFEQPEVTTGRNGEVYISFMTEDIANQTGPFSKILARCCIGNFSNGVRRDKETGEPFYWVCVSMRYEHKDGGSNGMDVCSAWYSDSKGWIFEDVG